MQDPEEERVRSGRGEFARVGETIGLFLVGGISVLMCLSVENARSGSRNLVGPQICWR
jgi:hypothetical protein